MIQNNLNTETEEEFKTEKESFSGTNRELVVDVGLFSNHQGEIIVGTSQVVATVQLNTHAPIFGEVRAKLLRDARLLFGCTTSKSWH
jgi:hypothetical protein